MQLGCIFLLLFAQHGALTHTLWHAAAGHAPQAHDARGASASGHDHDADAQGALCEYHIAYETLLGGHAGGAAAVALAGHSCAHAVLPPSGRTAAEAVPAVSRGPPLLL